ncbi:MAG: hypothetical protein Q9188_005335 [Gyalolechia gomerana]
MQHTHTSPNAVNSNHAADPQKGRQTLRVLQYNVGKRLTVMLDLIANEEVNDIDIIPIQEPWKNSETKVIPNMDKERFELVCPTNDPKARVCFFVNKKSALASWRYKTHSSDLETLFIKDQMYDSNDTARKFDLGVFLMAQLKVRQEADKRWHDEWKEEVKGKALRRVAPTSSKQILGLHKGLHREDGEGGRVHVENGAHPTLVPRRRRDKRISISMMSQKADTVTLRGGEAEASFKPSGFDMENVYGASPSGQERGRDWSDER